MARWPVTKLPTYFISHGGGPWPYMRHETGATFDQLAASLQSIPAELGEAPKAVLMISGHWEEQEVHVMANPRPPMIYDYTGFPDYTYRIKYSAPGAPALADRVQTMLRAQNIPCHLDAQRGFDHGTYSPLAVMFPKANVPVVQLSLRVDYDPAFHFRMGQALSPLRNDGVLIIGSGLSYHNLRLMGAAAKEPSAAFDGWLNDSVLKNQGEARAQKLFHWADAPGARAAHPQEDHLIPLMVAVGAAADEEATLIYHQTDFMGGVTVSSYRFGATRASR